MRGQHSVVLMETAQYSSKRELSRTHAVKCPLRLLTLTRACKFCELSIVWNIYISGFVNPSVLLREPKTES